MKRLQEYPSEDTAVTYLYFPLAIEWAVARHQLSVEIRVAGICDDADGVFVVDGECRYLHYAAPDISGGGGYCSEVDPYFHADGDLCGIGFVDFSPDRIADGIGYDLQDCLEVLVVIAHIESPAGGGEDGWPVCGAV